MAGEAKVYKYNHVLLYATFVPIDETTATLIALEASDLDYEGSDEIQVTGRRIGCQGELDALMPPGFTTMVYGEHMAERMSMPDWLHMGSEVINQPSSFFRYSYEHPNANIGLNKHTQIVLSAA